MGRKQGQEARKGRIEGKLKEAQEEKGKGEGRNGGKETRITGSEKREKKRKEATNKEKQRSKKKQEEARRSKKKQEETPYGNHKHRHAVPSGREPENTIPGTENTHGRPTHHSGNSKPESGN